MKYSVNVGVYLSVSVSASLEEKEMRVFAIVPKIFNFRGSSKNTNYGFVFFGTLALALTLTLFQPSFATDFAKASSVKEGFGGHSTRSGT
jgi:hypothetical protein